MCGIFGSLYNDNEDNKNIDYSKILNSIVHRGPDDQLIKNYTISNKENLSKKILTFGFVRLSIIDLSKDGCQPMYSNDKRYRIIFNGEIYNYLEIKKELEIKGYFFKTKTDTEVLLYAWVEWGLKCLKKVVGMFAFAIFDSKKNKLILARDAFGIKPLFYYYDKTTINFSSELPFLLKFKKKKENLNTQAIYDYFVYGDYDHNNETFYNNIYQLLPGHFISFNLDCIKSPKQRIWWKPNIEDKKISYIDATKKLRSLFLESIKIHLRSDVPLGVLLSGGIDSSAIASAVKFLNPKQELHTFSYIASEDKISEEKYVDIINKDLNATSHKLKIQDFDEIDKDIDDLILKQGEPFGGTSIYAGYRLYKMVKEKGFKVILEGQGADEILAGYSGYPGQRLLSLIETKGFLKAHDYSKKYAKTHHCNYFFTWKSLAVLLFSDKILNFIYKLKNYFLNDFYINHEPEWINKNYLKKKFIKFKKNKNILNKKYKGNRVKEAMINSITRNNLPALLRHSDRNSMAFSIESRVPFLTLPIVNFLLSLPEEYLISDDGLGKKIFRDAMRGIVSEEILNRKDKIGFATPEKKWFVENKEKIKKILMESKNIAILNKDKLLKNLDNMVDPKKPLDLRIWRYLNFTLWNKII